MHDNHSEDNLQDKMELSINKLKAAGFKITKRRKEILHIFLTNPRYLNAKFIHEQLREAAPTISYNTTYRNIYDFVEAGILESTEFRQEQRFRLNCIEANHHHHHFICTECGLTLPITSCPMDIILPLNPKLAEVEIKSHRFEIFGLCHLCKAG